MNFTMLLTEVDVVVADTVGCIEALQFAWLQQRGVLNDGSSVENNLFQKNIYKKKQIDNSFIQLIFINLIFQLSK